MKKPVRKRILTVTYASGRVETITCTADKLAMMRVDLERMKALGKVVSVDEA